MSADMLDKLKTVAVIGAGTMGQGIAQLALQAGHQVVLIDQSQTQLDNAKAQLNRLFEKFVAKNKITEQQHQNYLNALQLATEITANENIGIVIEAIVERMEIKQRVFKDLEELLSDSTILASNTSSLSITEIAAELDKPERFIGLHFFNPPGIMPLVEVVRSIQTSEETVKFAEALMFAWGKNPVRCKDTPSFIVNRVARPFYVESFRLLEENAVSPRELDASLREGLNFRMGPCELTDFIGQDVNYAVSHSLWEALRYPPHLKPSFVQGELVAAKYLGRKSGRGFFSYDENSQQNTIEYSAHRESVAFTDHAIEDESCLGVLENGVHVYRTNGWRAFDWEHEHPIALIDIADTTSDKTPETLAITYCPRAQRLMADRIPDTKGLTGHWIVMPDRPGLINLRVLSLIINEAATAKLQGVADERGIDEALKGGVNYPKGAFEWLDDIGILPVVVCLQSLDEYYPSGGYATSPYLFDKIESEVSL